MKNQDFDIAVYIKHTNMNAHKHSATEIIANSHHNSHNQNEDKSSERRSYPLKHSTLILSNLNAQ